MSPESEESGASGESGSNLSLSPAAVPAPESAALVIPAGQAQIALLAAFAGLAQALGQLEAVAVAIARALDQTITPGKG